MGLRKGERGAGLVGWKISNRLSYKATSALSVTDDRSAMFESLPPCQYHIKLVQKRSRRRVKVHWQQLEAVYRAARKSAVSFSLHYCEADDSWHFSVHSIAPSEEWEGKNRDFDIAIDCVMKWLDKLTPQGS